MLPLLRHVQTGTHNTSIPSFLNLFYLDSGISLGTGDGRRQQDILLLPTWVSVSCCSVLEASLINTSVCTVPIAFRCSSPPSLLLQFSTEETETSCNT